MNLLLLPPQNTIQKIAYAQILPTYYPTILQDYALVNLKLAEQIQKLLFKEINHLENSFLAWQRFNRSEREWISHLQSCGYQIP